MATGHNSTRHEEKVREKLKVTTDPVERIRYTALMRGPAGIRDIGRVFRNMDVDNSGQITFREFMQGVTNIGCVLDKNEMMQAYREIDTDDSGTISYDEFLATLRNKVMSPLRERVVRAAFHRIDADNSGTITIDDLRGVYDVSKHPKILSKEWNEEKALENFLATFDSDNFDGTITREEFFSYYAGISASYDSDASFILMMENSWKLNDKKRNLFRSKKPDWKDEIYDADQVQKSHSRKKSGVKSSRVFRKISYSPYINNTVQN